MENTLCSQGFMRFARDAVSRRSRIGLALFESRTGMKKRAAPATL
jgi:hypothetical protein